MDNMQVKDVLSLSISGLSFPACHDEVSEELSSKEKTALKSTQPWLVPRKHLAEQRLKMVIIAQVHARK